MNPALLALILTQAQAGNLNLAYNIGSKYYVGKYEMAVVLVESSACMRLDGDDGKSVGCGQLQIQTAAKVCGCIPDAKRLREDKRYNLRISGRFLAECFNRFWPDKRRSLYCYNAGIPAASKATDSSVAKSKYVARVLKALSELAHVRQTED